MTDTRTLTAHHLGLLLSPSRRPRFTRWKFTKNYWSMRHVKRGINNETDQA